MNEISNSAKFVEALKEIDFLTSVLMRSLKYTQKEETLEQSLTSLESAYQLLSVVLDELDVPSGAYDDGDIIYSSNVNDAI